MIENGLIDWVANLGFPIAVTAYLLLRLDGKLDKLISKIDELCNHVRSLE